MVFFCAEKQKREEENKMSEQKNNGSSMNFEMGSTLEDIFGATAVPQVDLGMPPAVQMQAAQMQATPVTNPPAAAPKRASWWWNPCRWCPRCAQSAAFGADLPQAKAASAPGSSLLCPGSAMRTGRCWSDWPGSWSPPKNKKIPGHPS